MSHPSLLKFKASVLDVLLEKIGIHEKKLPYLATWFFFLMFVGATLCVCVWGVGVRTLAFA